MDFVARLGIKITNAVIVSGVTGSEKDNEVFEYLRQYGTINRILTVDDSSSEFYQDQVVEFSSGLAVEQLAPALPYLYPSADHPGRKYCIHALPDVYTQTVGGSVTDSYLTELKGLAKLSGKDFEEVLRDVMSKFEESMGTPEVVETSPSDDCTEPTQSASLLLPHTDTFHSSKTVVSSGTSVFKPNQTPPMLSQTDIVSPDVQRIVVEHVVKTTEKTASIHSTLRLRAFSGRTPRPSNEADY